MKNYKIPKAVPLFVVLYQLLYGTSADQIAIIFYNFLEFHSKLLKKQKNKIVTIFPFLMFSPKPAPQDFPNSGNRWGGGGGGKFPSMGGGN